jgi:thiol-disulfide isomerase/thioredoxin
MNRCFIASLLLAVAACSGATDNSREDKTIVGELKRTLAALEKVRNDADDEIKLEKQIREHVKTAEDLLAEFEKAHPKSELMNEARFTALKILADSPDPAMLDKIVALAKRLKKSAVKGSTHASQADLTLLNTEVSALIRDVKDPKQFKEVWTRNEDKLHTLIATFLADYPKYPPALDHLTEMAAMAGAADATKTRMVILETVGKHFPDHPLAKEYRREQAVGAVIDFAFTPVDSNKETSLKDLRGKVVVIDVWATWCGPCKKELPGLKKLYEKYTKEGLAIVGVSLDDEDKRKDLVDYVKENEIPWPQVVGKSASDFADKWGIEAIPVFFVVDRQGKLRSVEARGKLEKLVPELLAEK